MLMSTLRLVAVIMGTAAIAWAADDPLVGTWKLNVSKSKFTPGPAPQEETRVYEAQAEGINVTVKTIEADGHTATMHISANYDGKDYPVTGDPNTDTRSYKKVNDHTLAFANKKGDKVTISGRGVVSADGKSRTVTISGTDSKGKKFTSTAVYDKQ